MTLRHWTQRQELLRLTSEPSIFWRIAKQFSADREVISWDGCAKRDTVIAQENEIFLLFRSRTAISGHGCPEKPEMSPDGE